MSHGKPRCVGLISKAVAVILMLEEELEKLLGLGFEGDLRPIYKILCSR